MIPSRLVKRQAFQEAFIPLRHVGVPSVSSIGSQVSGCGLLIRLRARCAHTECRAIPLPDNVFASAIGRVKTTETADFADERKLLISRRKGRRESEMKLNNRSLGFVMVIILRLSVVFPLRPLLLCACKGVFSLSRCREI